MTVAVAVDFGTSSTCVAVSVDAEPARVVLIDGSPLMPSAVYADGRSLFVGAEADRQAAVDPARYEPTPKSRIDDGSLLLGDTVVPVQRAIAAVLHRAVREARSTVGGAAVDMLVLTHPADWGAVRIRLLADAAQGLSSSVSTVAEPVAAALQHGASSTGGALLAVLDIGVGTTDVSVLQRAQDGFRVLATRGDPSFGGADIDELLMAELGDRLPAGQRRLWEAVVEGQGLDERRQRRALRADVRGAKESLSRHSYADVPLPGRLPDGHLTRTDLERLIHARVESVVDLLRDALRSTGGWEAGGPGTQPRSRAGVFLVGGSSRVPLFATTVHQRLGVLPVSTDQPETVVARGALRSLAPATARREFRAPAVQAAPAPTPPRPADLPPVATRSRGRRRRWLAAAAVVVAGAVGAAVLIASRGTDPPETRVVAAHRATMTVPADWQQARRTETPGNAQLDLTPDGSPAHGQGLFLQQTILSPGMRKDEVGRALQAQLTVETAAGKRYEAFDPAARYGGRDVISYRELRRDGGIVDWYVLVDKHVQVSVGCQHPPGDGEFLVDSCEQAVRSVRVSDG